jgi:hypothetical protein
MLESGAERGNCASAQHYERGDGLTNYRENTRAVSGGNGTIRRFDMRLNHFSRRILASTAAAGDGQAHLDFQQRRGALIDGFADLAIADGMAHADVHGSRALASTRLLGDWRESQRSANM